MKQQNLVLGCSWAAQGVLPPFPAMLCSGKCVTVQLCVLKKEA